MYLEVVPLIETGVLSLLVSIPIFVIRKLRWVKSSTSRKLLHILMAPIFMLCWSLFSDGVSGKISAVCIPLAFTVVFWVIGKGIIRFDIITDSMSRSGVPQELSKGPVHYGICISLATLLFWKRVESFYCILPISFGDGISAFFGPFIKGNKRLWWNTSKTWFGLLSFILCSFIAITVHVWFFSQHGWLVNFDSNTLWNAFFVSVLCGLTESLTISNYDNFTIFGMGILSYNYVHSFVCCVDKN